MSVCESGESHCRKARKIKSDEPAPGKMFSGLTPRTFAMVSIKPSHAVGGEVFSNQAKCSCSAPSTRGEGGNHASNTSALMICSRRVRSSKDSPIAEKKAPPWKHPGGWEKGKFKSHRVFSRN